MDQAPSASNEQPLSVKLHSNSFYKQVLYVLSWEDRVQSGLTCGLVCGIFFLLWGGFTVVSLVSYLLCGLLIASALYVFSNTMRGQPNPLVAQFANKPIGFTSMFVEDAGQFFLIVSNAFIAFLRDMLIFVDPIASFKFFAICVLVSQIGEFFSGSLLLLFASVIAFAWPRVYQTNQQKIDALWAQANGVYAQLSQKIASKVPAAIKKKIE